MKGWFQRFMSGRYGFDQFGGFLCIASLILIVIGAWVSPILYWLGLAAIIYSYFRILSRNTRKRYAKLREDMESDPCGRVGAVKAELDWLLSVEERACALTDLYERGELPLRVTHNDTKINNVLFDEETRKALVVIDLDTVMPGLVGHDFGDAIRFAANFVEEDSPRADKAGVNLNVYWAFAEGFLKETAATLTPREVETLGLSCFALACELATRFLDDYIVGDKYFKIKNAEHNLVRTRCQIALAKDMLLKMDAMNAIVMDCYNRYR